MFKHWYPVLELYVLGAAILVFGLVRIVWSTEAAFDFTPYLFLGLVAAAAASGIVEQHRRIKALEDQVAQLRGGAKSRSEPHVPSQEV
jgi:hypothetical protein